MIRYLVLPLVARAERMNAALPAIGRQEVEAVSVEKTPELLKHGFIDEATAQRWAEAAAAAKPGTAYCIYRAVSAVEVPSAPMQRKRFNDAGELVNV